VFSRAVLNVTFQHTSVILPVVYVVMWVRNLVCRIKRKFRPSVFQNRPLNRTFGPKKDELGGGWRKLTVEELLNLVYLPSIVTNGSCRI